MTYNQQELSFLNQHICAGDQQAVQFLQLWGAYLRAVDNIIDDETWQPAKLLAAFAAGARMYSDCFYQKHKAHLQMTILLATNIYADSVKWEQSPELWKRQWADVLRHADGHIISAVTLICGGWSELRATSAPFMAACYIDHKDRHGLPT